ncbi:hypothetical protein F4805DRAFT_477125 [Annulohypoxylon moriforme]|nr:hypothetical protein F4805DRAFT_477125 [Annulohypoxylon moriforme]
MDKATQTDDEIVLRRTQYSSKIESLFGKPAKSAGFSYFPKLPPELRAMVWRFYFSQKYHDGVARIHVILNWRGPESGTDKMWTGGNQIPMPNSTTLLACSNKICNQPHVNINMEAYGVARKLYGQAPYFMRPDWAKDLVYCASSAERAAIAFLRIHCWNVQNLAITMHQGHYSILRSRMHLFKSLKRLYVVIIPRDSIPLVLPRDEYGFVRYESFNREMLFNDIRFEKKIHSEQTIWDYSLLCPRNVIFRVVVDVDYRRSNEQDERYGYYEVYRRLRRLPPIPDFRTQPSLRILS